MTSVSNILLVTQEDSTAKTIKTVIDESGHLSLVGICQEVSQLRSYLSKTAVKVLVVDIDPDPSQVLYDLGKIIAAYPKIYVVVVCSHFTKELVVQAMQAGARHFLEKKTIASELSKELQQLIRDDAEKEAGLGSVVISIFSASGGCGATTVTVNVANELQLSSSRPVLAIDLDSCYGAVSAHLGIKSKYGIADVLADKNKIDRHFIESSAYNYTEEFHVLASPASIESPKAKSLQYENLPRALEACRQVYAYTVVDAPRLPEHTTQNLATLSDVILIVFQLTVKDVNFSRSMVSSLTKSGIASEKIMLLANRIKKRGPLVNLEDSKKAVGLSSCQAICSDWRTAMKSVNQGKPLAQIARRSGLRKDFQKLAAKISAYGINGNGKMSG